jgi:hypothetical protein
MTPERLLPAHFEALPNISTCYYFPKNRFAIIGDPDGTAYGIARRNACINFTTARYLIPDRAHWESPAKSSAHASEKLSCMGHLLAIGAITITGVIDDPLGMCDLSGGDPSRNATRRLPDIGGSILANPTEAEPRVWR